MRASISRSRAIGSSAGFTLIELVIVMGILVVVLTASYRLILDCLNTERMIDRLTLPEKVGEGILSLFRSDLSGTIWRNSGRRVFYVIDGGVEREARDVVKFLSTVEPTPQEDASNDTTVQVVGLRTITGICYFIKPNQGVDGVATNTLFRKEMVDFVDENPLETPGVNYEVYDKVAYLSIECYDGYASQWLPEWDSEVRIEEEQIDLAAQDEANEGIAKVSDTKVSGRGAASGQGGAGTSKTAGRSTSQRSTTTSAQRNLLNQSAPGVNPNASSTETGVLPPAAVPSAVRIEIGVYVAPGGKIERDAQGNPIVKVFATIVPILTAQRVQIPIDEDLEAEGVGGVGGVAGDNGGDGGPGGPGGGAVQGGMPMTGSLGRSGMRSNPGGPGSLGPGRGGAGRTGGARPAPGGGAGGRGAGAPGGRGAPILPR
jgi:prepilin-type N-terminal cleavage/methylation domain-containing protein